MTHHEFFELLKAQFSVLVGIESSEDRLQHQSSNDRLCSVSPRSEHPSVSCSLSSYLQNTSLNIKQAYPALYLLSSQNHPCFCRRSFTFSVIYYRLNYPITYLKAASTCKMNKVFGINE